LQLSTAAQLSQDPATKGNNQACPMNLYRTGQLG